MLTVSHISKTFNPGTVNEKCAIRDLSLHLDPGDFVTIIGANGAGKSTLFNAIAGSFYTDSGSIVLDGRDITFLPEYKRAKIIGRLFQDPMLGSAPGMTIEENLALAAGTGGWLMTLMMATMADPKLLLLDEHTAALDPGTAEKVLNLTREIVEQDHLTCLMITHNMQSALDLGNRTLMMDSGNIILDIAGEERRGLTVDDLLQRFKAGVGRALDNDRMLLS